jgi:glycosyltransferase involved in cell wall biosynthesis
VSLGPEISVIIPTLNRPRELRLCLEGLAAQTAPRERFEVIVVDDGSDVDIEPVTRDFETSLSVRYERRGHAGISASRNHGIDVAAAPLLVLYDDDLQPFPGFVAYCLAFHRENPAAGDTALLPFASDCRFTSLLTEWVFGRIYSFPARKGWLGWGGFWGGAITCKKSLFDAVRFDPEWLASEDAEFASRCSRSTALRVFYDPQPLAILTRPIRLASLRRREYVRGYFEYRLKQAHPQYWPFNYAPYLKPELYVLPDRRRAPTMAAAADGMERKLAAQSSAVAEGSLLATMWDVLQQDSLAAGWIAAREGRLPEAS